jgi:hypothetical protein|tara:strand:- start:368 stop:529 length:162 start_codon:yes stop_codon:yes gene_type:complete
MKVAKELGKSIQEVMQFSVLELKLWSAYFKIEFDDQNKVMQNGRTGKNRTRRR